jgi:glycine/D-amino acid oxidase-like deaminating enzyme
LGRAALEKQVKKRTAWLAGKAKQKPQEHTGSYYAATANDRTDHAPLLGEQRADVCIVGAGFSGISAALHLVERGYDVRVVEANRVGWGASGRNGGQIIGGISGEEKIAARLGADGEKIVWDMRWAGHDIIRQRVETYGIDCDLKWGYLDVAIKPRHLREQEKEFEAFEKYSYPHEYRRLSREEVAETIGTRAYTGGLLNMGNGHLHPLNLCIGEARAAVSLGATIHEQSPVLRVEDRKRPRVVTAGGSITADFVVLAGNAYLDIEPRLRGHLFPVNSYIIATEPLTTDQVAEINPMDLAVCDPNFVLEYFRLSADKRLLFGGRFRYFGVEPGRIREFMPPKMHRIYPQLKDTGIDYAWGGTIGVTLNRVPQLGRLADNILYLQGYSGHGVNVTHLAGQIVAEAVAGTMERLDVFAGIAPVVVPGTHLFRKPLTSLGMLYYQIKDRL